MAAMAAVAAIAAAGLQVGGTIVNAIGAHNQGTQEKAMYDAQAQQEQNNANTSMAVAEQKEQQQNKETAYVTSNAQAAAAAGGGAATDPTVNTVMKTIAGEGRYRALTDMYAGQQQAQNDQNQANMDVYSGRIAKASSLNKMYGTIIGGASSMFDKYASIGGGGGDASSGSNVSAGPLPWQLPIQYQNQSAQNFYG